MITPNFLSHFEIDGISDINILVPTVSYLSYQLGFYFRLSGLTNSTNRYSRKGPLSHIHTVKFECSVGTGYEHTAYGTKLRMPEYDTENGELKVKKVKTVVGLRRVFMY